MHNKIVPLICGREESGRQLDVRFGRMPTDTLFSLLIVVTIVEAGIEPNDRSINNEVIGNVSTASPEIDMDRFFFAIYRL